MIIKAAFQQRLSLPSWLFVGLQICLLSVLSTAQGFEKPSDVIPMMVAQPGSPVRVDAYSVDREGALTDGYTVTNVGSKAIRSYRIARYFDDGGGFVGQGVMPASGLLQPGASCGRPEKVQTIALAEKKGPVLFHTAWIMVVDVEFKDGSKFSDETRFNALVEYYMKFGRP